MSADAKPTGLELAHPGAASSDTAADSSPVLWRLLGLLPEVLAAAFVGFSTVVMAILDAQHYRAALVLPLATAAGLVLAGFAGRAAWRHDPRLSPTRSAADILVLVGAVGFAVINAHYAAQDLQAFRDPTTYTVAGQWLVHHGSPLIDPRPSLFGPAAPVLSFYSPGYGVAPHHLLYAQGNHLLPALLAVGGWLGGPTWPLRINAMLGGVALLLAYGVGRRITSPLVAAFTTCGLALTLPMIGFARDSYTEVAEMGLLLGGVLLLWLAAQRDSMPLFLIAGLSFGAVTMAHVDGMIIQLSVVGYLIVALLAAAPARRRRTVGRLTAFVVGDAATTALGLLDLQWLSPGYYHDRHHDLGRIALAAAALAIAGLVAVTATWLWPMLRHWWSTSASRPVSIAGAAFLVAAFTVLATRPWWLVARNHHVFPSDTVYISSLQRGQHLSVDPTRVYTELTMNWISWYTGWLTIGLGILGLAWWVWRGLRRPDLATLALPLVVLVPALLYLNHPAIDPDQLWATRRLLWAVYPGMFLAAAVAIGWLVGKRRMLVAVAAALSIVVAGYPLLATRHLFRARVGFPLLTQTERICRTIGPHAALALAGPYGAEYLGALRSYCDVPAGNLRSLNQPTLAALAQAVAAHGRTLYVVSAAPLAAANGQPLPVFNTVTFKFWDAVLTVPAKNFGVAQNAVVLARVAPDGALTPVPG